jgi:hypothetical protein
MKRKFSIILLVMAVLLIACSKQEDVPIEETQAAIAAATEAPTQEIVYDYTEEEIQAAKDAVLEKFNSGFQDCQMQRLEYIKGKYLIDYAYYAERTGVDRVIVLESDYSTGPNASGSLNPNDTYQNWKWILIDDGTGWSVWTHGYG